MWDGAQHVAGNPAHRCGTAGRCWGTSEGPWGAVPVCTGLRRGRGAAVGIVGWRLHVGDSACGCGTGAVHHWGVPDVERRGLIDGGRDTCGRGLGHMGEGASRRCRWRRWVARGALWCAGAHVGKGCGGRGLGAGGRARRWTGHGETESLKPRVMVAVLKSWLLMLVVLVLLKQQVYLCHPWKLSPTPTFLS